MKSCVTARLLTTGSVTMSLARVMEEGEEDRKYVGSVGKEFQEKVLWTHCIIQGLLQEVQHSFVNPCPGEGIDFGTGDRVVHPSTCTSLFKALLRLQPMSHLEASPHFFSPLYIPYLRMEMLYGVRT